MPGINIGRIEIAFLAREPATLLSIPSESKKSYLLIADPSVVRVFSLDKTLLP